MHTPTHAHTHTHTHIGAHTRTHIGARTHTRTPSPSFQMRVYLFVSPTPFFTAFEPTLNFLKVGAKGFKDFIFVGRQLKQKKIGRPL